MACSSSCLLIQSCLLCCSSYCSKRNPDGGAHRCGSHHPTRLLRRISSPWCLVSSLLRRGVPVLQGRSPLLDLSVGRRGFRPAISLLHHRPHPGRRCRRGGCAAAPVLGGVGSARSTAWRRGQLRAARTVDRSPVRPAAARR
ncbi:hypothetical protein BS78_01G269700 [Paspalum vaginatum]|nr:hypothetical protein BS78_01G269700 [Paspalum vaginatum]